MQLPLIKMNQVDSITAGLKVELISDVLELVPKEQCPTAWTISCNSISVSSDAQPLPIYGLTSKTLVPWEPFASGNGSILSLWKLSAVSGTQLSWNALECFKPSLPFDTSELVSTIIPKMNDGPGQRRIFEPDKINSGVP
jgi:hypothetical protein